MQIFFVAWAAVFAWSWVDAAYIDDGKDEHHHHHHHHKHHRHHAPASAKDPADKPTAQVQSDTVDGPAPVVKAAVATDASTPVIKAAVATSSTAQHVESTIVDKMKRLEAHLTAKSRHALANGHLLVNGPLPADFSERFSKAVSSAFGADAEQIKVVDASAVEGSIGVVEVSFVAQPKIVKSVEDDAADPESALARGSLHSFLVAKDSEADESKQTATPIEEKRADTVVEATPIEEKGIDIDASMPYGDLEPFGREDTAQELTESSVQESDQMVDQLERAEVAEEKRAVFRALTRLRGAAITSFDGVARSQTGNIDEYNKVHKWRKTHPLHHLADEESDIARWAFPSEADF